MKLTYALILAAASCGMAFGAATAYTTPVGYETLPVAVGVNFLGLRLQQPVVVAGLLTGINSTSITDTNQNFGTLLTATTTYILEITNANGVTQEFLGSAASGSSITTPNLTAVAAVGDAYKIRTAPTLANTFGASNSAGLDTGFFGFGGDIVLLPNPATPGGFDQYYYDAGYASWGDVNGNPVDGTMIAWNYADGVLISATGNGLTNLTVTGEVKKGGTTYTLQPAINFLSSVSPAGATLASAFGASLAQFDHGFFGFGGDIFLIPNALAPGGFDQYYYDDGYASWGDVNGNPIDGTTISLASGLLISNDAGVKNVLNSPPASYSSF